MLKRLKKLRQQFILTNMVMVGIILATIFFVVCVISYRTARRQVYGNLSDALEETIESRSIGKELVVPKTIPKETDPYTPLRSVYIYTAAVAEDGTILSFDEGEDEHYILTCVQKIMGDGERRGVLRADHLVYVRSEHEGSSYLAFCSDTSLLLINEAARIITGGASAAMFVLFFAVSRVLAGIAIRPVEEAWTGQERFIADASHDLKTPLTVILADAELLRAHIESGNVDPHWIDGIAEEAERMRTMVESMLELVRAEQLKGSLELVPTDLSDMTEQAILQLEPIAFERQITLESKIRPHIEYPTDPGTFTRLLYILIENAIKYTPDGGKIGILLRPEKQFIRLSVENPTGIAKEDLPHIFERFYRAEKARSVGGSGLGLSIAKNLADALRCNLKAESEGGKTTFSVLFRRQFLSEIAAPDRKNKSRQENENS